MERNAYGRVAAHRMESVLQLSPSYAPTRARFFSASGLAPLSGQVGSETGK